MTWLERTIIKHRIKLLRRQADDLYIKSFNPSFIDYESWREMDRLRDRANALEMELNYECIQ